MIYDKPVIEESAARRYHSQGRPGKIEIMPTKPHSNQKYLSLAYSPGVAEPCMDIAENEEYVYKYTAKGNLVGVITDGSAVLGLGNIGPLAGKPVMEGKALLFKAFSDIDAFDIEVKASSVDEFVNAVVAMAPTFGGINLEDIKSPECFEIEERLKLLLDIPVMHDDQHGTAVTVTAALINALRLNGKKIDGIRVVINGAGAAAIATARMFVYAGVSVENIIMCDRSGVIKAGMAEGVKREFATECDIYTLEEAINGADMFLGLSGPDLLTTDMLESMAENPIVFALANPAPEIAYEKAMHARSDIIFGTGRSDFTNQINNLLGFPYIFRGALDVRASTINNEMKLAAAKAIADLALEPVPESVLKAYGVKRLSFGRRYILPKPLDFRLISEVSCAVARAAVESGVARVATGGRKYWEHYKVSLQKRQDEIKGICYRCKKGVEL